LGNIYGANFTRSAAGVTDGDLIIANLNSGGAILVSGASLESMVVDSQGLNVTPVPRVGNSAIQLEIFNNLQEYLDAPD
jgi:hypothetical protein